MADSEATSLKGLSLLEEKKLNFDVIKTQLKSEKIESFERDALMKMCNKLQLKTSGTKEELIERLLPLKDEKLFTKRVDMLSKKFKFKTSLPRENIPPTTAAWRFNADLLPKIKQEDIDRYQMTKRQGKKGQYRKALRMFQSRRMKTIKVLKANENELFIKASVLKSYNSEVTRNVIVMFKGNSPVGAYCECPVGICGLCCHAILVLLQIRHFTLHNELLLALTCTQKLQKWHRPASCKNTSANVKAASHICLKYFRNVRSARKTINKRTVKKVNCSPKSVDSSDWLTRNVSEMSSKVETKLKEHDNMKISNHFLQVLTRHKIESGLYLHLSYKNAYLNNIIQEEHNYSKQLPNKKSQTILTPRFDKKTEDIWHSGYDVDSAEQPQTTAALSTINDSVFVQEKTTALLNSLSECKDEVILSKLPNDAEKITSMVGISNYVDVAQGSEEWLNIRIGVITASKLPSLLGLSGHKEYESSWFCIKNNLNESTFKPKKFRNFQRGKIYEKAALENFSKLSG